MIKNDIPQVFMQNFPLYYNYKVDLSELANMCGMSVEDTFECIKIVGIIDKVEIPNEQKNELKEKIDFAKSIFERKVTNYEEYSYNRKVYRELLDLTDKMVYDICKFHENVRSQIDSQKLYKDRGEVILDQEAESLLNKAFKVLKYRYEKLYE